MSRDRRDDELEVCPRPCVSHYFFGEHVAGELRWTRRGSKKLKRAG